MTRARGVPAGVRPRRRIIAVLVSASLVLSGVPAVAARGAFYRNRTPSVTIRLWGGNRTQIERVAVSGMRLRCLHRDSSIVGRTFIQPIHIDSDGSFHKRTKVHYSDLGTVVDGIAGQRQGRIIRGRAFIRYIDAECWTGKSVDRPWVSFVAFRKPRHGCRSWRIPALEPVQKGRPGNRAAGRC